MLRHPGRTVKLLSGSPPSLYVAAPAGRHDSVEVLAALLDARLAALTRSIATALEIAVVSPELVRLEIDLPSIDEIPETLANVNVMKQPIHRRVTKRHCQCLHIYACAGALVKLVHEVFMSLPTVHEVEAIGTRPHGEGFTPILNRRDWDAFIR